MRHVLLTNDDGYQAEGLRALAEELADVVTLSIVAPSREQSGTAQSLTLRQPIVCNRIAEREWAIDGTPADCVIVALHKLLPEKPDLLISGINHGANLGENVYYLGTVGAAREGALHHIPSMAVSLCAKRENAKFENSARAARATAEMIFKEGLPDQVLLNVNVPEPWNGSVQFTRQSKKITRNQLSEGKDPRGRSYFWLFEQPEIAATARIFAFAQLVARDFLGLPRELYTTVPRFRHVHVEQHLVRQAFLENHFRGGPRCTRGIFKFRIFSFRAQRDRHRWNVVQRAFPRRPHGPQVVHVFTEVRAVVDSGNQQVRLFRQKLVQRHDHAIRGGAVNGPLALRNAVAHDGLPERQRLRRAALLAARGNNAQCYNIRKLLRERPQPFRLISIVVCQKYMSHMSLEHFVAQNAWVTLSAGSHLSYQG